MNSGFTAAVAVRSQNEYTATKPTGTITRKTRSVSDGARSRPALVAPGRESCLAMDGVLGWNGDDRA
jgi:hypothetical protein